MKKLYYTVDKELKEIDSGLFDATGNKTILVYEIINNRPQTFCEVDCVLEDDSEEEIQDWLIDNGHGDEEFELIEL